MKRVTCSDLVPGCAEQFRAADEARLVAQYAAHARRHHGAQPIWLEDLLGVIQAA